MSVKLLNPDAGPDSPPARNLSSQDPIQQLVGVLGRTLEIQEEFREQVARPGVRVGSNDFPAEFTAAQDNFDFGSVDAIAVTSDALRTVTGFANGRDGQYLLVINVGSNDIRLNHQHANSDAENRIISYTGGNLTLSPRQSARLWYDDSAERWRILGH